MNLHHNLHRNNKGIGTVFGMVFFLLIVMVVFASFMVILNQNTGLDQTVMQTRQMDSDKANEQLTITQLANANLYTNIRANSVTVNCNVTNTGTIPVQLKRLWFEDTSNYKTGNLLISNPNIIIQQGGNWTCNMPVTVIGALSNDTFIFWFETARGNQFFRAMGHSY
jgi:hypothetical protein